MMLELTKKRHGAGLHLLLLAALSVLMAGMSVAGEEGSDRLDLIRRFMSERGEYDNAERQLKAFLEEYRGRPIAAEALLLLGFSQDKLKKNAEAAASYSRVLAEYPAAPVSVRADAALGAADAYFRLGKYADAINSYTVVLDVGARPEQAESALLWRGEAKYRQGVALQEAGDNGGALLKAAAADFTAFMERYPEAKLLPSAVFGGAFAFFDGGDYVRSLEMFKRFSHDFPTDQRAGECRYYAGESLYRLKRYDEAKKQFLEAATSNGDGAFAADARAGAAWAAYDMGQVAEAAEGFEAAAGMAAGDSVLATSFLYDAGCAWRESGNSQKAGEALKRVAEVKDHELNGLAWFRLGTLWQEQAKIYRERAEKAVGEKERNASLAKQREIGESAALYFRKAIESGKLGDEEVEARSLLGEVLLDAGRFDEAAATFEEIARRWPLSERAPWAMYHQALAERELSLAATDEAGRKDHLAVAAAALRASLAFPQSKTRLQAAWALADYLALLGDGEASREQYRWLANDAGAWARSWTDHDGRGDPTLENRAREYASDALFRLGESYYFGNDYPRATGFYQEILAKHGEAPQAAMAMLRLGEIAEAGKDLGGARTRYEDALRLGMRLGKNKVGTTIGYAQLRLGILLLRLGQKDAIEEMRRRNLQEASRNLSAVLNDPPEGLHLARPYYFLAEAKYALGLKKEALADYENSIKADASGDLADAAWFGLAWTKRELGDAAGALAAAEAVIERFPGSSVRPDAYALVAAIRRAEGDSAGALAALDRLLAEYPGHSLSAKAELERASALDETGRHDEAAEAFQAFLRDHPEHPDVPQALYQRSWALWNRIRPQIRQIREMEAKLYDLTGGGAVADLPEADRIEAARVEGELGTLTAAVRKSEDEILFSLRNLVERFPDYPVADAAWLRIGEIVYDRGDYQQASAAYQKALASAVAKNSDMADKAQYRLAWSMQRLAEAAEKASLDEPEQSRREAARKEMWEKRVSAIDAFESILGRYPKSDLVGDACFRSAELRRRSGQDNVDAAKRSAWFESAAKGYRQALERGGNDAAYRSAAEYGLGLSLLQNGQSTEAREVFHRLLRNPDGPYVQDAYWGLGQANLNLGAYADASAAFEQALLVDKTTETAAKSRFGLGVTAALAGDNVKARDEFLAVDLLYPNYPEWAAAALVRAARAALDEGLRDKALGDLERVLARYNNTPAADEARDMQSRIASQ